jgi:hypothetical protein
LDFKVKATASNGTLYEGITTYEGIYQVPNLPLTDDSYELELNVPGHNNVDGEIAAFIGEGTNYIPSFRLTKADGERLKSQKEITFGSLGSVKTEGDHLADLKSFLYNRLQNLIEKEVTVL